MTKKEKFPSNEIHYYGFHFIYGEYNEFSLQYIYIMKNVNF